MEQHLKKLFMGINKVKIEQNVIISVKSIEHEEVDQIDLHI